jgi:hypothetical protein
VVPTNTNPIFTSISTLPEYPGLQNMLTSWWHAAAVLVLLCGLLPKLPGCPGLLLQVNAEALASSAELRDKLVKIQAETNQALKAIYDR